MPLLLFSGVRSLVKNTSRNGVEILLPTDTPTPGLKVYITGAVKREGVYTLKPGDRLEQVLEAAGGATEDADLSSPSLNLALRVEDEGRYHIPFKGEIVAKPISTDEGKININTASASLLETLPGIGETLAKRIVDYREKNGPFRSIQELTRVSGIGTATLEALRDLITVGEAGR